METTIIKKTDLSVIKNEIKKLSEEQKFLRNQRKTVNIKGERTMEPWAATMRHSTNRYNLRILYAVYGVMRGKSYTQIEPNSKWEKKYEDSTYDECHPLKKFDNEIKSKVEKYSAYTKDVEVQIE